MSRHKKKDFLDWMDEQATTGSLFIMATISIGAGYTLLSYGLGLLIWELVYHLAFIITASSFLTAVLPFYIYWITERRSLKKRLGIE